MTDWLQVKNNASSSLASAITAIATSLTVKTGEGNRFPSTFPFHITIDNEILEVTARTTDTMTVTRAQEDTIAASHISNTAVRLNITAAILTQMQETLDSIPFMTEEQATKLAGIETGATKYPDTGEQAFLDADHTKLDGIESGADVTDATNVNAAGAVMEADYDAQTILAATNDNTPAAITITEQTVVGRITGGNIKALSVAELITLALSAALPENIAVKLVSALSADGKYSGIVEAGTAGATLAFGDLVYLAVADSKWELADANAAATAFGKLGICIQAANENAATTILLLGKVRADAAFPTLTVGAPVFISTTPGDITNTAPTGSGDIVRIIGYGNTGDELYFCPENTYLELV